MKYIKLSTITFLSLFFALSVGANASAQEVVSQNVTLETGWNIVSTPMVLDSHSFSVDETSENFDIYILDASQPTGWATMAALGQSEFTPLYGYFINNKTNTTQALTFNYDTTLEPNERLFERDFLAEGWYSIGVADSEYAVGQHADRVDTDNPSKVLSLLEGKYDRVVDFTNAKFEFNRRSVALSDPWKVVVPNDIDALNDLRETKGYAIYIKDAGARYNGTQDVPVAEDLENTEEEIIVRSSVNDPDSTTLVVESDGKSDLYSVFMFTLDSDDSDDEINITSIPIEIELSESTFADIIDDAELIIAGTTYSDYSIVNENSGSATLTFNLGAGATIYPGELLEVELRERFNALPSESEGVTIQAMLSDASAIVAESIDGVLDVNQLMGVATGEVHTLRTSGLMTDVSSVETETYTQGDNDTTGVFTVSFDVTALEDDFYVSAISGISYIVEGPGNMTDFALLTSTGDEELTNIFIVREGETETFTLTVTGTVNTTGQYRVTLDELNFSLYNDGETDAKTLEFLPSTDYRTGYENINATT